MPTFNETIEHLALYVEMAEGALILIAVCDDTVLRRHAADKLRQRLSPNITWRGFTTMLSTSVYLRALLKPQHRAMAGLRCR